MSIVSFVCIGTVKTQVCLDTAVAFYQTVSKPHTPRQYYHKRTSGILYGLTPGLYYYS